MIDARTPLHLFEGFGVELEYMIVARETLDIAPLCDQLIHKVAGKFVSEIEMGELSWCNELVLHVVELKTNGPAKSLDGLAEFFHRDVRHVHELLQSLDARLLPTAMHPWMDPHKEMHLWPHEFSPVYEAFDRIFSCRGHGWANLQCTHLNLPFGNDEEFGRLHAAIRLILPIIPALAASSPIMDGRVTGCLDNRLDVYRNNARRIPSVTGRVIPEPIFTPADYQQHILEPMYRDIAPHDPDGVLQDEWLNARGAIARFDRNAIEIRLIDIQECPQADLAILHAIVEALRGLIDERWSTFDQQCSWEVAPLESIMLSTMKNAGQTMIKDSAYLKMFGYPIAAQCTAMDLWRHIVQPLPSHVAEPLNLIFNQGTLSRRMTRFLPPNPTRDDLARLYRKLADCLLHGTMLHAPAD